MTLYSQVTRLSPSGLKTLNSVYALKRYALLILTDQLHSQAVWPNPRDLAVLLIVQFYRLSAVFTTGAKGPQMMTDQNAASSSILPVASNAPSVLGQDAVGGNPVHPAQVFAAAVKAQYINFHAADLNLILSILSASSLLIAQYLRFACV